MSEIRYWKPYIFLLPIEDQIEIAKEMMNSPKPDREALRKKADELEQKIYEERIREGYVYPGGTK